jgi:hypothetical protein
MPGKRVAYICVLVFSTLCLSVFVVPEAGAFQIAEPAEKVPAGQHQHGQGDHHHLRLPMGEEKCEPSFTYEAGSNGPGHWRDCATPERCRPRLILSTPKNCASTI